MVGPLAFSRDPTPVWRCVQARLRSLSCLLAGLCTKPHTAALAQQLAATAEQWLEWALAPAALLTGTAERLALVLGECLGIRVPGRCTDCGVLAGPACKQQKTCRSGP